LNDLPNDSTGGLVVNASIDVSIVNNDFDAAISKLNSIGMDISDIGNNLETGGIPSPYIVEKIKEATLKIEQMKNTLEKYQWQDTTPIN